MTRLRSALPRFAEPAIKLGFVAIIAATVVAVGLLIIARLQSSASDIPQDIANYRLLESVTGTRALQMVSAMHQGPLQVTEAWIGYYEQDGMIWSGTTGSSESAKAQLESMASAIGKGGTPFSNIQESNREGRRIFTVRDSSSIHYFFQSGTQVIWVTLPRNSGSAFIDAVLRKY